MKVKLCGFTEIDSVKAAIASNCDFLGFVFYEASPRYISIDRASEISSQIPLHIAKVAVVVGADLEFLGEISQKFAPDFIQFHGGETPEFLKNFRKKFPKIKIIKAFSIETEQDLRSVGDFEDCADMFLFDGKVAGSGKKFDWRILHNLSSKKDWFLSGGLNAQNVEEALRITGAPMIDISSGIEKIRGHKSPELITEFMKKVRSL